MTRARLAARAARIRLGRLDCGGKSDATPLSHSRETSVPSERSRPLGHESGVALRFPPQSKTLSDCRRRFWTAVAERSADTAFGSPATPLLGGRLCPLRGKSGVALRFPPHSKNLRPWTLDLGPWTP
jgi:hypothetical protein